ncbi:MAG: peroxidase-related enzyme [Deltaproteobacteria bacterium]|nr:peroxidase-related enzyme [Deltaproteobacteria bacterium]
MPHIPVSEDLPGIRSLMAFRPETAGPLCDLAEVLLRSAHSLSRGDRELIAAFVSSRNECDFCCQSHSAFAAKQLDGGRSVVSEALRAPEAAPISDKMKALLSIAAQVQKSGKAVTPASIDAARAAGATDLEIHDTVLIAAAFCMYNRYVDGLAAVTPTDPTLYDQMAERIVADGYRMPAAD